MKKPLLTIVIVVTAIIGVAISFYSKRIVVSVSNSTQSNTKVNTPTVPAQKVALTSATATVPVELTSEITKNKTTSTSSVKHHAETHHHAAERSIERNSNAQVTGINVNKLVAVASSDGLQPRALKSALNAYEWALYNHRIGSNRATLTVVDFTLPSYEKRMWVLNLHENKVLMRLYTTQGSGSGYVYATRFSNVSRSEASSIGLFTTSDEYYGKHGMSMRLNGLQYGINSNARTREIVVHDAAYASAAFIRANHRAGHSWGCFAVDPAKKQALLNDIKGGSVFFAYAPQIVRTSVVSHGPFSV